MRISWSEVVIVLLVIWCGVDKLSPYGHAQTPSATCIDDDYDNDLLVSDLPRCGSKAPTEQVKAAPKSETNGKAGRGVTKVAETLCWSEGQDVDAAIMACTELIQKDPSDAGSYYARGRAYARKKDMEHAIADNDKAIALNPKHSGAYNNRGLAYRAKGDIDRAIADYDRAIALDPKAVWAYNNRGNAYRAKGDTAHAMADYGRAIELDPNYTKARQSLAALKGREGQTDYANLERQWDTGYISTSGDKVIGDRFTVFADRCVLFTSIMRIVIGTGTSIKDEIRHAAPLGQLSADTIAQARGDDGATTITIECYDRIRCGKSLHIMKQSNEVAEEKPYTSPSFRIEVAAGKNVEANISLLKRLITVCRE